MPTFRCRHGSIAAVSFAIGLGAVWAANSAAWAANDAPPPPTAAPPAKPAEKTSLEPFLPPKSVRQSAVIGNKKVDYVLTVGAIPLKDDKGEVTGEVVYTSYVVPASAGASRPVTFSMNGGPGAASAYLNLGALGPKHVNFGRDGTYASDSPGLSDNANSWLDFTDLVFIDPIGTGYSRSHLDEEGTVKTFLKPEEDIHYLGDVIDAWLRGSLWQHDHHPNIVLAAIALTGFVVARQVKRLLALSSYYEHRLPS